MSVIDIALQGWAKSIAMAAYDPMFSDYETETATGYDLARDLIPNWHEEWEPRRYFRGPIRPDFYADASSLRIRRVGTR